MTDQKLAALAREHFHADPRRLGELMAAEGHTLHDLMRAVSYYGHPLDDRIVLIGARVLNEQEVAIP